MRILTVLTYYKPHVSGLTIYAERLAKALVLRGHEVTILASRHEGNLPKEELDSGIQVVRTPVLFRLNKGVISPALYAAAARLLNEHDVMLLHLPQFDSGGLAVLGRVHRRPTVVAYHCDLLLPPGLFNRIVNGVVLTMNDIAGRLAHRVVAYTDDFAEHSRFLRRHSKKRIVIAPPVELPCAPDGAVVGFRQLHNPDGRRIIGMATRFAAEKGIEILLDALPEILSAFPDAKVIFAGQHQRVWGEDGYFERLRPVIDAHVARGHFTFLGVLDADAMAAFYQNLDILVVPSLNSTESFGLVQIEAMQMGCPVVASNLPGVRQPILSTGMGEVVPVGDAKALAGAVIRVISSPDHYRADSNKVRDRFLPDACAAQYERLFRSLL